MFIATDVFRIFTKSGLFTHLPSHYLVSVSDLKAELKRRNLPVSGSKPQLIERLKPYATSEKMEPAECSSPQESPLDTNDG